MELEKARAIAERLKDLLEPACEKVAIAGSIRRQKPEVKDIELLAVPKYFAGGDMLDAKIQTLIQLEVLGYHLNKLGRRIYGPQNKFMVHLPSGMAVDIFSTNEERWPVALVVRTGGKSSNIQIATAALRKGWRWHAYGSGFTTPSGEVACRSERDVFEFVGLPYLEPWERQ